MKHGWLTAGVAFAAAIASGAIARAAANPQSAPARLMRVALLVDTGAGTSSGMHHVRASIDAFVDAMPPNHELLLVTTGRRVQVRVPPTSDLAKIKKSAGGITADGGPTPL